MAKDRKDSAPSPPKARSTRIDIEDLSLGERVCLALIDEGVKHGWALGTELAPDSELGRVWTLTRPLTYRSIDLLTTKALVRRAEPANAKGRERVALSCSPAGRRLARTWLDRPVEHLRDVRTELLLKLVLRRRRGLEIERLVTAQQALFGEHFDALTTAEPDSELVELWRRESARAIRRFLEAALAQPSASTRPKEPKLMRLSARNQVRARVATVVHGDVLSTVKTVLADGQVLTAVITKESVVDLDIAPDDEVLVVVKSTEVMLAKP